MIVATRKPSLRALQRGIAAVLRHARGVGAGLRAVRRTGVVLPIVAAGGAGDGFAPRARLDVYADAYQARLVEVLAGDYGAVRARLGERSFARLARAYVQAHPSRHPNLNRFGARFPAFLRRQRTVPRRVVDLARLEQALTLAFDACEFVPLGPDALAALSPAQWAKAVLTVNPSVQLLRVPAVVADAFTSWRRGESAPTPRRGAVDVCVVRVGDQVIRRELPRVALAVLARLRRGVPLGRALRGVPPATPVDAWFAQWRADGLFTAVR